MNDVVENVRNRYAEIARTGRSCCGDECGPAPANVARAIGYSEDQIDIAPEGANLGLGCGAPLGAAAIRPGETVLDLGSGAGFDAFLAGRETGEGGRVIGVDMTPEMVAKARRHAAGARIANVEFREGRIEALPIDDATVDVAISNCVINLAPDKRAVFRDVFRVLKPGGRLVASDLVRTRDLPDEIRESMEMWAGCIAGTERIEDYVAAMEDAGFTDIEVVSERPYAPGSNNPVGDAIVSATFLAYRRPSSRAPQ